MRGTYVVIIAGLALALAGPGRAGAEVSEVRIVAQNGSNYLPLYVMQGHKLVEKHAGREGSRLYRCRLEQACRSFRNH